ncbi:helix-turn-helix domain-containing protein [Psychromicrobium xiongbiense]|uniref:helix-turn-helix domain-containing protein n=1 Tax=Psychromicrobium xiongbiense TaxID=3051184 RepID=UPI002555573C|nr:helix-turn-helix domain-containing protein [Psychromicrobium sp. YIM S02556]
MTEQASPTIGARLRHLRTGSGRSLRSVAEAIGISPSALSQIETGVMQPSVNRLIEIVTVLQVPVSAIFDDHEVLRPVNLAPEAVAEPFPGVLVATRNADSITTLGQGVVYRRLTPVQLDGIDLYETTYPPLASSSIDGAMLVHEGYEAGRVLEGSLTFEFGEGSVELGSGESLSFWATRPHRVVNSSPDTPAVALWLTLRNAGAIPTH